MWTITFYEKENGEIPVQKFIQSLEPSLQAKATWEIDLLEKHGTNLTEPHVKWVKGKKYKGLLELRIKQGSDIARIFYCMQVGKEFIMLHGIVKKTEKTPPRELNTALKYKEDYQRRCEQ